MEKTNEVFIDVDPKIFVARAESKDFIEAANAEYMLQIHAVYPASLVKLALDNPGTDYGRPHGPGTPIYLAAWRRANIYIATTHDDGVVAKLFETKVDPEQPVYGIIDPNGRPMAAYQNRERNERLHW